MGLRGWQGLVAKGGRGSMCEESMSTTLIERCEKGCFIFYCFETSETGPSLRRFFVQISLFISSSLSAPPPCLRLLSLRLRLPSRRLHHT